MYSAGNLNSSRLSWSMSSGFMKSYQVPRSSVGSSSMRSMTPIPFGMGMGRAPSAAIRGSGGRCRGAAKRRRDFDFSQDGARLRAATRRDPLGRRNAAAPERAKRHDRTTASPKGNDEMRTNAEQITY